MATSKLVEVPPIRIGTVEITLVGTARLVIHKFAEKALTMMLDKQMQKPGAGKREAKDPIECFKDCLYPLPGTEIKVTGKKWDLCAEGSFGFPAIGLKAAIIRAATDAGMQMTTMKRAIRIPGELMKINCEPGAYMRMDYVRLDSGTADVRFRPEFREWEITQKIQYNKSILSLEQLLNLIRIAGFGVGLGEGRPSGKNSSGEWGTFVLSPKVNELEDEEYR